MRITEEIIKDRLRDANIDLFPTQQRLCIPIINRIYQKMANGLRFDEIKVHDDLIIDGHHRYISSLLAKAAIERIQMDKTSATRKHEWVDVGFVEEEWDTQKKIEKLNSDDAEFNNLTIAEITKMIK